MTTVASLFVEFGANTSNLTRAFDQLDRNLNSATGGFNKFGKVVGGVVKGVAIGVAAMGAAVAAGVGSAVKGAASMEQKVADIRAVFADAAPPVEELNSLIMSLGMDKQLKVTAVEAGSAIEMLAKNGVAWTDIQGGMAKQTVLLANATGSDLATAADIATDAMAVFGLEANEMDKAVAGIVGVVNSSKFGIDDYALALANGGSAAKAAGMPLEQFNALIALTSSEFKSGQTSGTGWAAFLSRLVPTTDKAAGLMRDLGLITADGANQFYDANGALKDADEILRVLQGTFGHMSEEQRAFYTQQIFGRDAAEALNSALRVQVGDYDALMTKFGDLDAVTESANTRMDTLSGAWEIFMGIIETVQLGIGQKFIPMARDMVKWLIELAQKTGPAVIDFFGKMADKLSSFMKTVGSTFARLTGAFSLNFAILGSENASFGEKLIAIWDMIAQVGLKLWQSLLDGIAALLPQWLQGLGEWALGIWEWIKESAPKALEALGKWAAGLWGWLVENLPTWAANLWEWAKATWQWLVDVTPIAIAKLGEWGTALFGWLSANLPIWGSNLAKWAEAAWKWLSDVVPIVATKVVEWGGKFLNWVITNLPLWASKLGEWGAAAWQWLSTIIPTVAAKIGEWGSTLINWLAANSPRWQHQLTIWGAHAWGWLSVVIPKVIETLGRWGEGIFGWLGENLPTFINMLLGWGAWLVNWIGFAVPKAIDALAAFVQGLRGEGDGNGANKIGQMVYGWAQKLWTWITDTAMPRIAPAFLSFLNSVLSAGSAILTALGNLAVQWGQTLWHWITVATPVVLQKLAEWGGKLWGWITTNAPTWGARLGEWGRLAWQWLVDTVPIVLTKLGEWATSIWTWIATNAPMLGAKLMQWAGHAWNWLTGENGVIWMATGKLGEWATAIYEWVTDPANVTTWSTKLFEWVGYAWDWLVGENGVVWLVGAKLGEWATAIYDWVSNPENRKTWVDELARWATDGWTWIRDELIPNTVTQLTAWAEVFYQPDQPGGKLVTWLKTTFPNAVDSTYIAMGILQSSWTLTTGNITKTDRDYSDFFASLKVTFDSGLGLLLVKTSTGLANLALAFLAARSAMTGEWETMWLALDKIQGNHEIVREQETKFHLGVLAAILTAGGEEVTKGFGLGIDSGSDKAFDAMDDFGAGVNDTFARKLEMQSPSRVFEGFGRKTVEGFDNGFGNRWGSFVRGSGDTATDWIRRFKNIFGIHSPSTVFAEIGASIVDGLAIGMESSTGKVTDAFRGLNDSIVTQMEKVSPYDTLTEAFGEQKGREFFGTLKHFAARAEKHLQVTGTAAGNKAYQPIESLMAAGDGMDLNTLKTTIDNIVRSINTAGQASGHAETKAGLQAFSDQLGSLMSGGVYAPGYGTTPGMGSDMGGGSFDTTALVEILKLILAEMHRNGNISAQGFGGLMTLLQGGSINHGGLVNFLAGARP